MNAESIHPRVYFSNGVKKNTAAPRSRRKLERALAGIEKHLERHPRDNMSATRLTRIKVILAEMPAQRGAAAA